MCVLFFMLYFLCCMKLSFFNFFLSSFLKLKANGSRLMRAFFWVRSTLKSDSEERDHCWTVIQAFWREFTTSCLSLTVYFPFYIFFETQSIALSLFSFFPFHFFEMTSFLDLCVVSVCYINVLYFSKEKNQLITGKIKFE